jgi:hypothetical protein
MEEQLVLAFLYGWCSLSVYLKLNEDLKQKKEMLREKERQQQGYKDMKKHHYYKYRRKHRELTVEQCQEYIDNFYKTYKHPYHNCPQYKYYCEEETKED